MLDEYFQAAFTIKRLRSGPSGPYLDGFARNLGSEGYGWWTVRRYLRSAAHIGRFTQIKGAALNAVTGKWPEAFRRHLPRCRCPQSKKT